jgi:hypothetical protein
MLLRARGKITFFFYSSDFGLYNFFYMYSM